MSKRSGCCATLQCAQVARSAIAHQKGRVWRAERRPPCPATDTDTIGFALVGAPPPFVILRRAKPVWKETGDCCKLLARPASRRCDCASARASSRRKPGSSIMGGLWIPACAGTTRWGWRYPKLSCPRGGHPVKAVFAIAGGGGDWIPAFAGMTRVERAHWIPAYAGMSGVDKERRTEAGREKKNRGGYCAAWATRSVTGSICIRLSMRPRSFWNSASMRPVSWRPRGTWMVIGLTNLLLTRIS